MNRKSIIAIFALFAITSLPSFLDATPQQGSRLIEYAPGKRMWMTPAQVEQLSIYNHKTRNVCGGFLDMTEYPNLAPRPVRSLARYQTMEPKQQAIVNPMVQKVTAEELLLKDRLIESWGVRNYNSDNGKAAAIKIHDEFVRLAGRRLGEIQVSYITHNFKQPSVWVRIPGQGPLANQHVVLGAHEDSIVGPGADDDASGTASLLYAFEILMKSGFKPHRTIDIFTYAGEEAGLLGSRDISAAFRKENVQVFGVFQLDMTLYKPKTAGAIYLITDWVDQGLTEFTGKLVTTYTKAPLMLTQCGYACSDHASWNRNGYPSVFPFEAGFNEDNPYIHTTKDTSDKLTPAYGVPFVQLALAFAVEMAEADAR